MGDLESPAGPKGSAIPSDDFTPVTTPADFERRRSARIPTAKFPNSDSKELLSSNAMSPGKQSSELPSATSGDSIETTAKPEAPADARDSLSPLVHEPVVSSLKRGRSTPAAKKIHAPKARTKSTAKSTKAKKAVTPKKPSKAKETIRRAAVRNSPNEVAQKSIKSEASDELPHNLGKFSGTLPADNVPGGPPDGFNKENQGVDATISNNPPADLQSVDADAPTAPVKQDPEEAGEDDSTPVKKPRTSYGLTTGKTPFPTFKQPTVAQCEEVNRLLTVAHGQVTVPKTIPEPSLTVTGCGEVPSVLDALIRTILSANTTSRNSSLAFEGLVTRFGILSEGIGKGSVNWNAVRQASLDDIFKAIERGGMGKIKSKTLKKLLDQVYEENQERMKDLDTKERSTDVKEPNMLPQKTEQEKEYRHACADQHFLSLDHVHKLSTPEAIAALVKYHGIGPKTAACVCLFCLQRPCFAVDTHIFRLCKWLGWLPPNANEVTAFSHLEVRIPNHLKYSLHKLLITHGKTCPRCRAGTGESNVNWHHGCEIEHLVERTGARKGNPASIKGSDALSKAGDKRKRSTATSSATKSKKREISVSIAPTTSSRKNPARNASAQSKDMKESPASDS
ncbi:uncharacterized protein N7443_000491 [Penicillium atrosanguineum]|uniref:uncharacterized protein n=1 Tax=Penicillium atrosanguineum TaxID=1132637 RepID=UPI0023A35AF9|nr:uncharacterized protein N7443_000491 [Penicillium atrosanguineum]KAJ5313607.1 hypothetical protein N7443_000491 [Penicillium atrosanguineum]